MKQISISKQINQQIIDIELTFHDGSCDILDQYAELKQIEKQLKTTLGNIHSIVLSEGSKLGNKMFEQKGYIFQYKQGARYYDFKGVPLWVELQKELKRVEERSKAVANDGNMFATTDDGEQIDPCVVKFKSDSLMVKKIG